MIWIVVGIPLVLAVAAFFAELFLDDYGDFGLALIAGAMTALVSFLAIMLAAGLYLDQARFAARAECRAQRMDEMSKPFSKEVVCIPFPTRNDTTTINGSVPVKVEQ